MKTKEERLMKQIKDGAQELILRVNDPAAPISIAELKGFARAWQKHLLFNDTGLKIAAKFPIRSMAISTPRYVRQFLRAHQGR